MADSTDKRETGILIERREKQVVYSAGCVEGPPWNGAFLRSRTRSQDDQTNNLISHTDDRGSLFLFKGRPTYENKS